MPELNRAESIAGVEDVNVIVAGSNISVEANETEFDCLPPTISTRPSESETNIASLRAVFIELETEVQ
jgi:hypothetical protein